MDNLNEQLKEIGLSNSESKVYISLLKNSPIGGGELAKLLNMDRTHTYNILSNLISKGLATHILKNNKKLFRSTSPKNLLNQVQKKETIIKSILPELLKIEEIKKEPSNVIILEGKEGLRDMVRMLFDSEAKDICVFGGTGKSYDALKYEMPLVGENTKKVKINGRIITGENLRGKLFTNLKNFEVKYIQESTPTSTMIFGNKVSINVFDEKIFVILIESKSVADSYRKYFEYMWEVSKS
jgi:sugar-specific transcriptional regulator TrmB